MNLDPLKLMQSFSGQVALAALRTDDDGHVLDEKQIGSFTIVARQVPDFGAAVTTEFAHKDLCFHEEQIG